ncbi:MAG: hypothetical protein MZU95_01665 [Desulfomicrobium escambiense]|nr:hypothetical protein [Desulfomicrobium escambiense]
MSGLELIERLVRRAGTFLKGGYLVFEIGEGQDRVSRTSAGADRDRDGLGPGRQAARHCLAGLTPTASPAGQAGLHDHSGNASLSLIDTRTADVIAWAKLRRAHEKEQGVLALAAAFVVLTLFPFQAAPAAAQQQEDLSQKTQPKAKVIPKQSPAPGNCGRPVQDREFTVIVASPSGSGGAKRPSLPIAPRWSRPSSRTSPGYSGQGHVVIRSAVPASFRGRSRSRGPGTDARRDGRNADRGGGTRSNTNGTGSRSLPERPSIRLAP